MIKDEMKPKKETILNTIGEAVEVSISDEKKDTKFDIQKIEIDKVNRCLKDKDKRISKLEDYFLLRNRVILSIITLIICSLPTILILVYIKPLPVEIDVPVIYLFFMLVGLCAVSILPIILFSYLLPKIWGE